jgi:hypothetical protein
MVYINVEVGSLTVRQEHKFRMSEDSVVGRIHGPRDDGEFMRSFVTTDIFRHRQVSVISVSVVCRFYLHYTYSYCECLYARNMTDLLHRKFIFLHTL